MKLTISIDRASKSWAIFDGLELVHKFTPYDDELDAIGEARRKCEELGDNDSNIVYPRITRMSISTKP